MILPSFKTFKTKSDQNVNQIAQFKKVYHGGGGGHAHFK